MVSDRLSENQSQCHLMSHQDIFVMVGEKKCGTLTASQAYVHILCKIIKNGGHICFSLKCNIIFVLK